MKNFTKFMIAGICGMAMIIPSNASAFQDDAQDGCYATTVVATNQGLQSNGNAVAADRSDASKALMAPDKSNAAGGFYSLGMNGSITLQFGGAIYNSEGDDIMVYETSFSGDSCGGSDDESAMIEVSQDGYNWISLGTICRDGGVDLEGLTIPFVTQIRITDETTSGGDGYDVDGVEAIYGCDQVNDNDVCYGSFVVADSYMPGPTKNGSPIAAERTNPANALGMPENDDTINFVSLGYGGQITIGFDGIVLNQDGDDLAVLETTFNNATFDSYPESAAVYVSQNGVDFYLIGEDLTNVFATLDISNAVDSEGNPVSLGYISSVKLVDTTPAESQSQDAFDLDGIIALSGCTVPEDPNFDVCYAAEVLEYIEGTKKNGGVVDNIRTATPENVLGEPEGTDEYVFTTLGYGGSITLAFDGAIFNGAGPDLAFIETSFNKPLGCETYPEYADIYVSFDDITYHFAGTICKSNNTIDISDAGDFAYINYVKVVNNDEMSTTEDGYDLDGVVAIGSCQEFNLEAFMNAQAGLLNVNASDASQWGVVTYPNPASGISNIEFVAPESGKVVIDVYDINGRNVGQVFNAETFTGQRYKASLNVNSLNTGLYFYKITTQSNTISEKFIITQ